MKFVHFALIFLIICFVFGKVVFAQETEITKKNLPEISNVEPREIFSGMALKIEGYRLGVNDSTKVIFLQNANEFVTTPGGGSWNEGNISQGLQELNVVAPEELLTGKCQIIIEYNGQKGLPFTVDVLPLSNPPKLNSVKPLIAMPGEVIWIDGVGFNLDDTAELIDSTGKIHIVKPDYTSSADTSAFTLGNELPDGLVTLRFIENRSGSKQASNSLTFKVKRTATPLDLWQEDEDFAASGQWFQPTYTSNKPLEKATKIEFLVRQDFQEQKSFITNFKNIMIQIPKSFAPGKMEIQNRVWRDKEVSEWSKSVEYEIADSPAKPKIWSFINVPLRAEAMFRQNGSAAEILPIVFSNTLQVLVPEKIKDGQLEIFTRFWKDGKFTDWELDRTFDIQKSNFTEKTFEFGNFNKPLVIGNDSPEFFRINRGEILGIDGTYFVGSVSELQITLENSGQKISLKSSEQMFPNRLLVKLPGSLPVGNWNISVVNTGNGTVTDIRVKLQVN